jgi:hypothetical protein
VISESAVLWRTARIVVTVSALVVLFVGLIDLSWPWQDLFRNLLFFFFFYLFSLWSVYRSQRNWRRLIFLAGLLLVGVTAGVSYAYPPVAEQMVRQATSAWLVGLSVVALCASWLILTWSRSAFPDGMGRLGISPDRLVVNVVIGAIVGGTLGLHLLLTTGLWSNGFRLHVPTWSVLTQAFCYYAGLYALGEELLFRGLLLPLLADDMSHGFWKATWKLTGLNLLVYLTLLAHSRNAVVALWLIVYHTLLILINSFLRYRQRSVIPCLACNITFAMCVVLVVGL